MAAAAELQVDLSVSDVEKSRASAVRGEPRVDPLLDELMHARCHGISEQRRLIGVVEGEAFALESLDVVEQRTLEIRDAQLRRRPEQLGLSVPEPHRELHLWLR